MNLLRFLTMALGLFCFSSFAGAVSTTIKWHDSVGFPPVDFGKILVGETREIDVTVNGMMTSVFNRNYNSSGILYTKTERYVKDLNLDPSETPDAFEIRPLNGNQFLSFSFHLKLTSLLSDVGKGRISWIQWIDYGENTYGYDRYGNKTVYLGGHNWFFVGPLARYQAVVSPVPLSNSIMFLITGLSLLLGLSLFKRSKNSHVVVG